MSDGFFSDTHVTEAGLQGSLGSSVGMWDMVLQGFRQQYRVDSAFALDQELHNRWQESLRAAGLTVNVTGANPYMMRDFAQFVRDGSVPARASFRLGQDLENMGQPVETGPDPEFEEMRRANEAIRQLNNPRIRTFEQILEEVSAMQHGVEEETASMSERTGWDGSIGELLGAMAGSFTLRDPLNVVTAPVGAGRTIAMRIATDMAVAGGVTAVTEFTDVVPNRALAGLPERNPYYNIVASTLGAGLIRGGIEGIGAGVRNVRGRFVGEDIDFDLRDTQLQQMFAAVDTPTSRAASSLLDDTIVFERSNPYGEGQVAGYRWQAELDATARALNGETPAPLDLPPIPSEYIDRALSFQSVKETAPDLWNRLEDARTRLVDLDSNIAEASARELSIPDAVRLVDKEAAAKLDKLSEIVNDPTIPEPTRVAADMEARATILRVGQDKIMKAAEAADTAAKFEVKNLRASRKAANKRYREAYQKVEAEAVRLEHAEVAKRSIAQTQSMNVLGPEIIIEPMTGPMTRFDFVEAHAGKVEVADAAIPTKADVVNNLEINPETNTVDIGTKTPVSVDFKVPFDDGELSVREILDDLSEDRRLEEAVKGCTV